MVVLGVVIAAACSQDDGRAAVAPISGTGTVSAPARPVIVDPLPAGWSVESAEIRDYGSGPMQSLYLAPGSTPRADRRSSWASTNKSPATRPANAVAPPTSFSTGQLRVRRF